MPAPYTSTHQKSTKEFVSLLAIKQKAQNDLASIVLPAELFTDTDKVLSLFNCNVSNFWGYEVRLMKETLPDLLICIRKESKKYLSKNLNHSTFASKEWNVISTLINEWIMAKSDVYQEINNVWFEFDQKDMKNHLPKPNLFIAPSPFYNAASLRSNTEEIFNPLIDSPLEKKVLNKLEHAAKLLDYESWIPQIGMMLARNKENIRIYIHKLPENKLTSYLERVGWKHTGNEFSSLLTDLYKFTKEIDLDLDIHHEVGHTIGLECYLSNFTTSKLSSFLSILTQRQLASSTMTERLIEYFEQSQKVSNTLYRQYLHHIKITYNPLGTSEAKAYLAIRKN